MVDENLLRRYLLGNVSPNEAELCDEASIVDDNFAEKLEAIENDLLDAYVWSELKGEELAQFEAHYLASPLRRDKVYFARSFQKFAENEIASSATVPATSPSILTVVPEKKRAVNF